MAVISSINGTAANNVIDAHRGDAYQSGRLVWMVSGSSAQGGSPVVNVLVNGQVVLANVVITADFDAGTSQEISWALPPGLAIGSVAIEYVNDINPPGEDRNLYVNSVTLNGTILPLPAGTYSPEARPAQSGGQLMAWNGPLQFTGASVNIAMAADSLARSVTIDGLAGIDSVIYQGRALSYNVTFDALGMGISSKSGAFGPDSLRSVERVLFDDQGTYGNGADAAVTQTGLERTVDGGSGIDTLAYSGARAAYTIGRTAAGNVTVSHTGGLEGVETLVNVERLMFNDARIALDVNGNGGMSYRLYQAAFNRIPDTGGLGFWMQGMDGGLDISTMAQSFMNSQEFILTYGSNLSTQQFVTNLYQFALHRGVDTPGLNFWVNHLNAGNLTRADTLVQFSESAENQAAVIGVIQNGMTYTI